MKLRLLDDSVRLRLSRQDVAELAAHGRVEAAVNLPSGPLTYALVLGEAVTVDLVDGTVTVSVPRDEARDWAGADEPVGLYGEDGPVAVAVEKDFHCLIPRRGGDPEDFYPNPKTPRR